MNAGLSFVEYDAPAGLSDRPDHTMRMGELVVFTNAELSRLSHLIGRLENRGLVRREPDPNDRRYTRAILTAAGQDLLAAESMQLRTEFGRSGKPDDKRRDRRSRAAGRWFRTRCG